MIPRVLTIAGSDPGGGAGIQADLKTFSALRVYGMSVLTSVTAQNTIGVTGIHDLPPDFVVKQFEAVASDIGIDAAKTGMLSTVSIIDVVSAQIKKHNIQNLVVDPVMRAKGGDALLKKDAETALKKQILPLARIITPNIPEAEALTGRLIKTAGDMERVAENIHSLGPKAVLIKGGHSNGGDAVDLFYNGKDFTRLEGKRIETKNTHGTGCTLSAAIAANLAKGMNDLEAVQEAKRYLTGAIANSFSLGRGHGPLNHFWK